MCLFCAGLAAAQDEYPDHPDSVQRSGIPQGKIEGPFPWHSEIYPGTVRDYWLYVPAQYDPDIPAAVMIVQDGLNRAESWGLPTVMDNLIASGEIPVQIGIFVDHGKVVPETDQAQPRFNRSFEYDSLGDRYAGFLIEEILPEVAERYNLSERPDDRLLAGASSGGICAFNAAWHRPDAFRRVLSTIGTYVALRGGNEYPWIVRKSENKPLRVFLQDGSNDLNIYAGDWWIANQDMLSALRFAGYDVNHVWGEGGHNARHAKAILPDALRWLWRDWPAEIPPGRPPQRRINVLLPDQPWKRIHSGHGSIGGLTADDSGRLYFSDVPNSQIWRVEDDGTAEIFVDESSRANGIMAGHRGYIYACHTGTRRIVRYDQQGREEILATGVDSSDLVVMQDGIYWTDPQANRVWYLPNGGEPRVVTSSIMRPTGITISPDHAFMSVTSGGNRHYMSYQVATDGSLQHGQPYGYIHWPDDVGDTGASGMTSDTDGNTYVATRLGIQVFDQLGRVHQIVEKPGPGRLSSVALGGRDRDMLYAACGGEVYVRKIDAKGFTPSAAPQLPPKPGL